MTTFDDYSKIQNIQMSEKEIFSGFSKETVHFLKELKENNYKDWFEEHKHIYTNEVSKPLKLLATTLTPGMYNIDFDFEKNPNKMVSRIYRDRRFSRNKEPYHTTLWLNFQRAHTHWSNFPGYFAELSSEHFAYGMGLFCPTRKVMDNFRNDVDFHQDLFGEIADKALKCGFEIVGKAYKRKLENSLPANLQAWVQRKNVFVMKKLPLSDNRIYSQEIAGMILADFCEISELYHFMTKVTEE